MAFVYFFDLRHLVNSKDLAAGKVDFLRHENSIGTGLELI